VNLATPEIVAALRERFSAPEWAVLFEVASGTGANARRRADAVAMSLWPSRGLELHGVEVKASRSDWLREKAQPEKAEPIFRFMDRWWIVVGDPEIVKPGELPPTWGLLVPRGKSLVAKVEAPKLDPQPVSRSFLAALLRRAHETAHGASEREIAEAKEKARVETWETARAQARLQFDVEHGSLVGAVKAFEQASGVSIGRKWDAGDIGAAVKRVLAQENVSAEDRLKRLAKEARRLAEDAERALAPEAAEA